METKSVVVVLSSYNGEKYIAEQIDSILSQQNVNLKLLIRDDGSTDSTLKIITDYKHTHPEKIYLILLYSFSLIIPLSNFDFTHLKSQPYCSQFLQYADLPL